MKSHLLNKKFFDVIDSEEKAYWLGFLFADGHITKKKNLIIDLSSKDKDHLVKLSKSLYGKDFVKIYSRKNKEFAKLEVNSVVLSNSLINHGCINNKTFLIRFPFQLDQILQFHFLRGYFDGDGSIIKSKVANNAKITSNNDFIMDLKFIFDQYELVSYIDKNSDKISTIKIYGNNSVLKLYYLLYDNSSVFLERKYNKFIEIKNIIDENIKKTIAGTRGYPKCYLDKYDWYINNLNI